MPITMDINREKNLTIIKVAGIVPFGDFQESVRDYYKSGATDFVILDLKEAKGSGVTFPHIQIKNLAYFIDDVRKGREKGKTAMVATSDLFFGMCRTLEAYMASGNIEYQTFRTVDEAVEWIEDVS